MPFDTTEKRRVYQHSPRFKKVAARYRKTAKSKARIRRYWTSAKGKAKAKQRQDRRIEKNRVILTARKSEPCARCGGKFPKCCMDFHHVTGVKRFRVGSGLMRSTNTFLAEMAKCILLCANCHRIEHEGKV